jgi:hypothetical protein
MDLTEKMGLRHHGLWDGMALKTVVVYVQPRTKCDWEGVRLKLEHIFDSKSLTHKENRWIINVVFQIFDNT